MVECVKQMCFSVLTCLSGCPPVPTNPDATALRDEKTNKISRRYSVLLVNDS